MKGYEYKNGAIKSWPVYTHAKLDGIRMLCQDMGRSTGGFQLNTSRTYISGTLAMRSWLNNPYTHLTHIEELQEFFPYLPRYCTLD